MLESLVFFLYLYNYLIYLKYDNYFNKLLVFIGNFWYYVYVEWNEMIIIKIKKILYK